MVKESMACKLGSFFVEGPVLSTLSSWLANACALLWKPQNFQHDKSIKKLMTLSSCVAKGAKKSFAMAKHYTVHTFFFYTNSAYFMMVDKCIHSSRLSSIKINYSLFHSY